METSGSDWRDRMLTMALDSSGMSALKMDAVSGRFHWYKPIHSASNAYLHHFENRNEWQSSIHSDSVDEVSSALDICIAHGEPFNVRYLAQDRDGKMRLWRILGEFLDTTQQVSHSCLLLIICPCNEHTEAAEIGHMFNNQLSIIQGYGELLRDEYERLSYPMDGMMEEMLNAVDKASVLCSDLISLESRTLANESSASSHLSSGAT